MRKNAGDDVLANAASSAGSAKIPREKDGTGENQQKGQGNASGENTPRERERKSESNRPNHHHHQKRNSRKPNEQLTQGGPDCHGLHVEAVGAA